MKTFTPPRTPLLSPTPATLPPRQTPITSTPSLPEVHFIQIDEIDALGSLQHQNESQVRLLCCLSFPYMSFLDRCEGNASRLDGSTYSIQ